MARPRFSPTPEQRRMVRSMAAYGIRHDEIAACLGIRSAKTLRRHFREELDRALVEANAKVARTLFEMATGGKSVAATIFWLKSRAGWRDLPHRTLRPIDAPPFIVVPDKKAS